MNLDLFFCRRTLIQSFLFKFYLFVSRELGKEDNVRFASAINNFKRNISQGQQTFSASAHNIVGHCLPHRSAYLQVSGEATYIGDMPTPANGLYAALVLTKQPHARIKNIGVYGSSFVS